MTVKDVKSDSGTQPGSRSPTSNETGVSSEDSLALERLKLELARAPFHEFLRPEPIGVNIASGTVQIKVPSRPEFRRAYDVADWHGGLVAAIIDIAGHAAIAVKTGRVSPTIDIRVDYLAPARGDLTAVGRAIRIGRSIGRADIEICDASGTMIAIGRGTFSTLVAGK